MGSTGWVRCYWCEQWVNNAYIPDPIAKPLCSPCLDHYAEGHQVWRPNAVDHRTNSLWLVIPFMRDIPLALVWEIATYIEDPYRPGRGSRWKPGAAADQIGLAGILVGPTPAGAAAVAHCWLDRRCHCWPDHSGFAG